MSPDTYLSYIYFLFRDMRQKTLNDTGQETPNKRTINRKKKEVIRKKTQHKTIFHQTQEKYHILLCVRLD